MDEIAKQIIAKLKESTAKYGDEFKESLMFIHVTRSSRRESTWLVEYSLGSSYDGNQTKGGELEATVHEFMRRKGWSEANKPMVLIEQHSDEPTEREDA